MPRQNTRLNAYRIMHLAAILSFQTGTEQTACREAIKLADINNPAETKGRKYRIAKQLVTAQSS